MPRLRRSGGGGRRNDCLSCCDYRLLYDNLKLCISTLCLGESLLYCVSCREDHTYAAMAYDLRLAEDTDLNARLLKNLLKVAELILLGISLYHDSL